MPIHLIGLFQMPKGITSKDVEVLLDEDRVVITVDKTGLTHDLSVPCIIDIEHVKCCLDKDLKVLRLDMPVKKRCRQHLNELLYLIYFVITITCFTYDSNKHETS